VLHHRCRADGLEDPISTIPEFVRDESCGEMGVAE
jgi:hypothetical protein